MFIKLDPFLVKEIVITGDWLSFSFQGKSFKPSYRSKHHLLWGEYYFEFNKMYNFLTNNDSEFPFSRDYSLHSVYDFHKCINLLCKAISDRDFELLGMEFSSKYTIDDLAIYSIKEDLFYNGENKVKMISELCSEAQTILLNNINSSGFKGEVSTIIHKIESICASILLPF